MRKNFFYFLKKPFDLYFKNLYVSLPMLIFLIISTFLSIIFFAILFFLFFSFIVRESFGKDLNEYIYAFALQNPSKFLSWSLSLLLFIFIFFIVFVLLFLFFFTSTLGFSRDIINKEKKEEVFKKSFSYGLKFWKILLFSIIFIILSAIYFLIPFLIIFIIFKVPFSISSFFFPSPALGIFILLFFVFLIVYLFLAVFISFTPFSIIYYNQGVFEGIITTVKNTKKNFWETLGLLFCFFVFYLILNFFNFLSFVFPPLYFLFIIIYNLFYIPYVSLSIMLFIKEKWKK